MRGRNPLRPKPVDKQQVDVDGCMVVTQTELEEIMGADARRQDINYPRLASMLGTVVHYRGGKYRVKG